MLDDGQRQADPLGSGPPAFPSPPRRQDSRRSSRGGLSLAERGVLTLERLRGAAYLPAELSCAQRMQSGNLPMPRARFRSSMLLPSTHRVLSWYFVAGGLVEYHGPRVGITCSFDNVTKVTTDPIVVEARAAELGNLYALGQDGRAVDSEKRGSRLISSLEAQAQPYGSARPAGARHPETVAKTCASRSRGPRSLERASARVGLVSARP